MSDAEPIIEPIEPIIEPIESVNTKKQNKGNRSPMTPDRLLQLSDARAKATALRKIINEAKPPKLDKPKKKTKMELQIENIQLKQSHDNHDQPITENKDIQKEMNDISVEEHKEVVEVKVKESQANLDVPTEVKPVIESQANVQRPQIYKQGKFFCV